MIIGKGESIKSIWESGTPYIVEYGQMKGWINAYSIRLNCAAQIILNERWMSSYLHELREESAWFWDNKKLLFEEQRDEKPCVVFVIKVEGFEGVG